MARTIELKIIGEQTLHCAGCEQRVGNALRRLNGIESVQASAQSQEVIIRFDPTQVTPARIKERMELLGYEVTEEGSVG